MDAYKITQLSSTEYKFDSPTSFCINSNGNCMVFNNSSDVTVFEMMYNCDSIVHMPYTIGHLKVSQDKPISKIIRQVDLIRIYENATVQESQELACDVIYTADCAIEPVKAKVLQAEIVPKNNGNICCVLTNYGCCEIFKKDVIGNWEAVELNLVQILLTNVFLPKESPSHIKTYNDFKKFTNKFIITCFKISIVDNDMTIYLGTAAGYVLALKYNETSCIFEPFCKIRTSLNRISYLTICNNLILVGCYQGKVLLLKINFETITIQEMEYLWSVADGMSCQKAIIVYSEGLKLYFVAFCKAAHFIAFRLDKDGAVESSTTLYVSGIKVTGIESINENEFIIATITGAVKHIKVVCPNKEELYCEEQSVDHDFDSSNYQILGVAASASKHILSFLLYRNKEYLHRSKYSATTAFLSICKLSSKDSFETLTNTNFKNMNLARDLVMAVSLNIFNNLDIEKYLEYFKLETFFLPTEINDMILQRLQIKFIVTRKLAEHQIVKFKKVKDQTRRELLFLEPVLQLLHILERMRFLKELNKKKIKFSKFQEQSLSCMQSQFNQLLGDITKVKNDDATNVELHSLSEKFAAYFRNKLKFTFNFILDSRILSQAVEYCTICGGAIVSFKKCEQNHDVIRCSISCTQISLFQTKHCPHCYAMARNDDEANLQELYASDECIKCIYCRFLFKEDEMKFITK